MAIQRLKDKRKEQEEIVNLVRHASGFLPYYSDQFFEIWDYYHKIMSYIVWLGGAVVCFALLAESDGELASAVVVIILIYLLLLIIRAGIEKNMKYFGYQFDPDNIKKKAWGMERVITYESVANAVTQRQVRVNEKEFLVPYLHGQIHFPYEVGNAKQQKRVIDCYKTLSERIHCPMPKMTTQNIDLFDRAFYYRKSFRRCGFAIAVATFIFLAINAGSGDVEDGVYFAYIILAIVQQFSIFRMFKSVRLGTQNALKLKMKIDKQEGLTAKVRYHHEWEFYVWSLAMVLANSWILYRYIF